MAIAQRRRRSSNNLRVAASKVASLRAPLEDLARELRALTVARTRTSSSISALCDVALARAGAPEALQSAECNSPLLGDRDVSGGPQLFGADDELYRSTTIGGTRCSEEPPAAAATAESRSSVALVESLRSSFSQWQRVADQVELGSVMADEPVERAECWADEVLKRIRNAIERSLRDPREVFYRCCASGSPVMVQADLGRVLQAFEPDLPDMLHKRLWHSLGKEPDDELSYDEFLRFFGPRAPPPPPPPEVDEESNVGLESVAAPNGSTNSHRVSVARNSGDERRARVLLFRFGRALRNCSDVIPSSRYTECLSVRHLLQLCVDHRVPLSRAEVVSLFWLYACNGVVHAEIIGAALDAVSMPPPPEIPWARQAVASAGVAARSGGGQPLAGALATLGEDVDAVTLRQLLAQHSPLDDQRWETLLLAIDKQPDGKVLIEPLVQWAAGIGVSDEEVFVDDSFHQDIEGRSSDSDDSSSPRCALHFSGISMGTPESVGASLHDTPLVGGSSTEFHMPLHSVVEDEEDDRDSSSLLVF